MTTRAQLLIVIEGVDCGELARSPFNLTLVSALLTYRRGHWNGLYRALCAPFSLALHLVQLVRRNVSITQRELEPFVPFGHQLNTVEEDRREVV